jgi:hypothetical protein
MPLSRPRIAVPLPHAPTPHRAARWRAVVAVLLLAASFVRAQLLADADALIKRGHSAEATQNYDRAVQQGDAEVQAGAAVMYLAGVGETHGSSREFVGEQGALDGTVATGTGVMLPLHVGPVKEHEAWKVHLLKKSGDDAPAASAHTPVAAGAARSADAGTFDRTGQPESAQGLPAVGRAAMNATITPLGTRLPAMLAGSLAVVAFVGAVVWLVLHLTSGLAEAGSGFFAAWARHDQAAARGFLSDALLAAIDDAALRDWLSRNGMADIRGTTWFGRKRMAGRGLLHGQVLVAQGRSVPMRVALVKQDGAWKIFSLHKPSGPLSAFIAPGWPRESGVSS